MEIPNREIESLINQGSRRSAGRRQGVLASQKTVYWIPGPYFGSLLLCSDDRAWTWRHTHSSLNCSFSFLWRLCQGPWNPWGGWGPTLSQPLTCQHSSAAQLVRRQCTSPTRVESLSSLSSFLSLIHFTNPRLVSSVRVPEESITCNYSLLKSPYFEHFTIVKNIIQYGQRNWVLVKQMFLPIESNFLKKNIINIFETKTLQKWWFKNYQQ